MSNPQGTTLVLRFQIPTPERAAHLIAVAGCLGNRNWSLEGGEELELSLMAALEEYHMKGNTLRQTRRLAELRSSTGA